MPCKQTKSSSILSNDTYYVREYLNRCHLRALKHYPQIYKEKCLKTSSFVYDDSAFIDTAMSKESGIVRKSRLSQKCGRLERENFYLPYKKTDKFLKNSKKFRRKHCNMENSEKLQKFMYLNQLADEMIVNDSIVNMVSISNMEKRITKLFDQIYFEISKAKRKCNISNLLYFHIIKK